jgi:hypothetical protein
MDPLAYRRKLIRPAPEAKNLLSALDLLDAKSAAWRHKLPKGHAVGFACHESFGTGVGFGLSQLMAGGAITFKDGRVEQRNFDTYVPPYMPDAPLTVDVHIVPSADPPTGCGEPPVPVISPAVVNALSKLTGERYRNLPLVAV